MANEFFKGKLYSGDFKGLMPRYYTPRYKKYIIEETKLLKQKISGRILEAGVGIGRLIPVLAPRATELVGIDNSAFMLKKSREVAASFSNVRVLKADLENLSVYFPFHYFDYSLCLWNTLGNVRHPIKALKELAAVTDHSIFTSVFYKKTIKERIKFYKAVDVKVLKIDQITETFYLDGFVSQSFDEHDIQKLATRAGLYVKESAILGGVVLWSELERQS